MTLELVQVFSGPLAGASLAVPPGLTVVLASAEDGGAEIPRLFAGAAPRSGQVRAAERTPADDPALRSRLGVVLAEEPALEAASVESAVTLVRRRSHAGVESVSSCCIGSFRLGQAAL